MEMSQIGKEMLAFQEQLAIEHGYKPVDPDLFLGDVREKYMATLPDWCKIEGDNKASLLTLDGTLICNGYKRIVIGDYGAFIEIDKGQINKQVLYCKPGQEYRYTEERFSAHVKYLWLTVKDKSDCKIYFQKKTVDYADYVPGMYYISPFELYKKD